MIDLRYSLFHCVVEKQENLFQKKEKATCGQVKYQKQAFIYTLDTASMGYTVVMPSVRFHLK